MRRAGVWIALACVVLIVVGAVASNNAQDERNDAVEVANVAGATSCARSGFELADDGNGTHPEIYDCVIRGETRCVTYLRGVATDETATVRRLFSEALGSDGRPDCV